MGSSHLIANPLSLEQYIQRFIPPLASFYVHLHIEISSTDSCQSLQKAFAASDVSKIAGLPINLRAFLVSSSSSAEGSGREVNVFGKDGEGRQKEKGFCTLFSRGKHFLSLNLCN